MDLTETGRCAAIGLGSNVAPTDGTVEATLRTALSALCASGCRLTAVSRFYRTPAYPAGSGPDFVNAAALVSTSLNPKDFLEILHRVEAAAGRVRTERWGPRTLDIDLLAMDDLVLPDAATQADWMRLPPDRQRTEAPDRLILPHPRLQDRAFVLIPLAEIAPSWRHPATGRSVADMLAALSDDDKAAIRPI